MDSSESLGIGLALFGLGAWTAVCIRGIGLMLTGPELNGDTDPNGVLSGTVSKSPYVLLLALPLAVAACVVSPSPLTIALAVVVAGLIAVLWFARALVATAALAKRGLLSASLTPGAERGLRRLVPLYVAILIALISLGILTAPAGG